MPKISILLPTYREAPYIDVAINSVLHQYFQDWELIIIDDGLTNEAKNKIIGLIKGDPRIILISNPINLGIQKSLNKGLFLAKGIYIARIDDDDRWLSKSKLQRQISILDNNKECVLVGTGVIVIDENNNELLRYLPPETDRWIRQYILTKNCFVHPSVLYRKDVVLQFGGYSEGEDVKHLEDYDLWLKLGTKGYFVNISDYLISTIRHNESISFNNKIVQFRRTLKLVHKYKYIYPNYKLSLVKIYFKIFCYSFIYNFLPMGLQHTIFRVYKEVY